MNDGTISRGCPGRGRRRRRWPLILVLLLWGTSACLTAPALLPPQDVDLHRALAAFPPETERVEIAAEDGSPLRGVFVPAGEGAPVVLHLLESGGSPASLVAPKAEITWDLANLGFSSLMLDYRGVGLSEGEPSPEHLGSDAECMWKEAVRRAGSPRNVAVRCQSIGSVALALLLQSGCRPRAVVVVSPVRADTVVRRFARAYVGGLASIYAALVYAPVADVDVLGELTDYGGPLLCLASKEDELVSDNELQTFLEASNAGFVELHGGHISAVIQAQWMPAGEASFWIVEVGLPDLAGERPTATSVDLPAALYNAVESDRAARERFEEFSAYARREDPAIVAAVALTRMDWTITGADRSGSLTMDPSELWHAISRTATSLRTARRRFARTYLKAAGIPDRVVVEETGETVLEIKTDGAWRPLPLDFRP